ncbi:MAG: pectate lyase family protein, partial [Flavobacteriales bacterium]
MKKNILTLLLFIGTTASIFSQSVNITEAEGWSESGFIKWEPVANAESYNVYFTGEGKTDVKIDTQLIRNYGNYYRADALGLKAGTYTLKVAPVIAGTEQTATISSVINVQAYDRTGFAFSNSRVPGTYKMDGTPKDNAVVLYITENTKNTISLDVNGANANPCIGLQTILEGYKKGSDNRPLIIRLIGQITDLAYMDKGDIVIENNNNIASYITLEGVGDDAVADGWGIRIKNASNVEVRNIATMNCNSDEGDNIGLQQGNDYIWIHNNDFFYGDAGGDADQAKGDGALDCKKSTYVTFSYNHFWDSGKANLLGLSEGTTEGLFITYHHNWFDHSDSRHPRVRFYSAHVYNNYYDGNSKYGVGSTEGSSVFVEANYFRNCKFPMLTSMQGSDVFNTGTQKNDYNNYPTFSKEDGGTIKAFNNFISGANRFIAYGDASSAAFDGTKDFDAYVASTRNETIESTIKSNFGANSYNNFDTNASIMYSY